MSTVQFPSLCKKTQQLRVESKTSEVAVTLESVPEELETGQPSEQEEHSVKDHSYQRQP